MGVDESGRGAVLGPMVICGISVKKENIRKLKELGVKDSKLLSPARRENLFPKIQSIIEKSHTIKITAREIDMLRSVSNLNRLEARKFAEIIDELKPDRAILDSPEAKTKKFEKMVRRYLKKKNVDIVSENYADKKYVIVGGASILAKVQRDESVKKIEKEIGEKIGNGYPGDPLTIKFLEKWVEKNGSFPQYIRKSWITSKRILSNSEQRKIDNF